ncbi:MAG: hypothetical protein EA385_14090 [Salinarimonadaceae bacterium]|nr:MAG: hypothetical protein EA385_14090 [Salinarimonadaceae bacterium]
MRDLNQSQAAPTGRIVVRYAVGMLLGWLVARHLLPPDLAHMLAADPAIVDFALLLVSLAVSFATEMYYRAARRLGWRT